MKIIIGSDHAGFELKETCKGFLEDSGEHGVLDAGVFSRASSDYPQIAHRVAAEIPQHAALVTLAVAAVVFSVVTLFSQ